MALIAIAYLFASLLYLGSLPSEQVGRVLVVLLPIFLFFNLNNQSYSAAILLDGLRSTWRGTSGLIWASLLMFLIFFMFKISEEFSRDRKSVVEGKSVSGRVDLGGRRLIKKKTKI